MTARRNPPVPAGEDSHSPEPGLTPGSSLNPAGHLDLFDPDTVLYGTRLGAQLVGDSLGLLALLPEESVDLIVTSPPFALLRQKSYGNEDQAAYVQWLAGFGRRRCGFSSQPAA